jgi:hypothetical protein
LSTCPHCKKISLDEQNFCDECGTPISSIEESSNELINENKAIQVEKINDKSVMIFPDLKEIEIDESYRLVGRADLSQYSKLNATKISRGHFTIYRKNDHCYVEDGNTKVQSKPSVEHTFLNDKDITGKGKIQLSSDDVLKVSDVEIMIRVN